MSEKIRVMLCDDSAGACESYRMFINAQVDMECIGFAMGSRECVQMAERLKPDLLLLDIQMETEKAGIKILPVVKEKSPETIIVMLTGYDDSKYVFHSIVNGADGYILKNMDGFRMIEEIREAYREAVDKDSSFDAIKAFKKESENVYNNLLIMQGIMNDLVKLTVSEYGILREIYRGKTYKVIARERVVEECTIKSTAARIVKKMGTLSMKELIRLLRQLQIFDTPE